MILEQKLELLKRQKKNQQLSIGVHGVHATAILVITGKEMI